MGKDITQFRNLFYLSHSRGRQGHENEQRSLHDDGSSAVESYFLVGVALHPALLRREVEEKVFVQSFLFSSQRERGTPVFVVLLTSSLSHFFRVFPPRRRRRC